MSSKGGKDGEGGPLEQEENWSKLKVTLKIRCLKEKK